MTTIVKARHVAFDYPSHEVLKDLSFEIRAGEIIGLLGVNGAGKTTLLHILLGQLSAHGAITLFDAAPGSKFAKAHIGTMTQGDQRLRGVTAGELLKALAAHYPRPVDTTALLTSLGLSDLAARRLTSLSGGQLRRITFAAALVGNPQLLFLDEPTAGMDVQAREIFWRRIGMLKAEGKTVIITSHDLYEIQNAADRLYILNEGRFVFQGTFAQLQENHQMATVSFSAQLDLDFCRALPGVKVASKVGDRTQLNSTNGDVTLKALVPYLDELHHFELTYASLADIFVHVTGEGSK